VLTPIEMQTRFVFLMHPKEFKREKTGTGRLTHLCLPNSELHVGLAFDPEEAVTALIEDPRNFPVLLYPGKTARNLSHGGLTPAELAGRRLVVLLLDATWSGARKMLKLSPRLQRLPRIMFTPAAPSRFVIKQQPAPGCLSTLEAVHELALALERAGLDQYPQPEQLLGILQRLQDFQISCAADPDRPGYRHRPYKDPADRVLPRGRSGSRRSKYARAPEPGNPVVI